MCVDPAVPTLGFARDAAMNSVPGSVLFAFPPLGVFDASPGVDRPIT